MWGTLSSVNDRQVSTVNAIRTTPLIDEDEVGTALLEQGTSLRQPLPALLRSMASATTATNSLPIYIGSGVLGATLDRHYPFVDINNVGLGFGQPSVKYNNANTVVLRHDRFGDSWFPVVIPEGTVGLQLNFAGQSYALAEGVQYQIGQPVYLDATGVISATGTAYMPVTLMNSAGLTALLTQLGRTGSVVPPYFMITHTYMT